MFLFCVKFKNRISSSKFKVYTESVCLISLWARSVYTSLSLSFSVSVSVLVRLMTNHLKIAARPRQQVERCVLGLKRAPVCLAFWFGFCFGFVPLLWSSFAALLLCLIGSTPSPNTHTHLDRARNVFLPVSGFFRGLSLSDASHDAWDSIMFGA